MLGAIFLCKFLTPSSSYTFIPAIPDSVQIRFSFPIDGSKPRRSGDRTRRQSFITRKLRELLGEDGKRGRRAGGCNKQNAQRPSSKKQRGDDLPAPFCCHSLEAMDIDLVAVFTRRAQDIMASYANLEGGSFSGACALHKKPLC